MSQSISIRVHFDGKTFVPDEPVEATVNQPAIVQLEGRTVKPESLTKKPDSIVKSTKEKRVAALEELVKMSVNDSEIPLEALRRKNMYDDGRY